MKENSIEEDILNIEKYIELVTEKNYCECNELNEICSGSQGYGSRNVAYSMKRILSEYKRVIKENEEKNKKERKNKMNADEMFEKLGYEKCSAIDDEEDITFSRRTEKYIEYIIFDKLEKSVATWRGCLCCNTIQYQAINMEELQAINKKVEELGWK